MRHRFQAITTIIVTTLFGLTGCEIEVSEPQASEETMPKPSPSPEPAETEDPPPLIKVVEVEEPDADSTDEARVFTVITDPWSKYFREDPAIILIPELTSGIRDLLDEQQQRAREILSNTGQVADRPEYIQLEEALEDLKTAVPGAETRSGYSNARRRYYSSPSYSYAYSSGSTSYVRTGSRNYYYTVFNRVHKSSSPALARSVENIVYNASLEDLDQRIDALRQLRRVWSRKTNLMSPNGVEGIMREANMAYLEGIQGYTGEVVQLQGRLKRVQALIDAEKTKKETRLEEWRSFEANRLPVIQEYVERHQQLKVEVEDGNYELPTTLVEKSILLLACKIGERTLYFDLAGNSHSKHPFRLVSLEN